MHDLSNRFPSSIPYQDCDLMPDEQMMVACGDSEVFLFAAHPAQTEWDGKLWSWRANASPGLPDSLWPAFQKTDDCKSINGGQCILVSCSSGGCACVEHPSGRVIWYAQVSDAHSLELLPRERVVVAGSLPEGDCLELFDLSRSGEAIWRTTLSSGHAVVWDDLRERLWVLGSDELRCYALGDWDSDSPELILESIWPLPKPGGYDLQAVPQSSDLVVTTSSDVYLFDRARPGFRLHPALGGCENVVSVSVHPESERTLFVQGTDDGTCSSILRLLSPVQTLELYGERVNRVRWVSRS